MALTTGQAARYCLVTADTILLWIKKEQLPAQRTLGGQYRIFVHDLRHLMLDHGMSTAALDAEFDLPVHCWEYCPSGQSGDESACEACPVHQAKALHCFAARPQRDQGPRRHPQCEQCEYLKYFIEREHQSGSGSSRASTEKQEER
jgi:excisionase family DNA binding protein